MATAFTTEADELEFIIPELDTAYEVGDPCIAPIDLRIEGKVLVAAGDEVPDRIYDLARKHLEKLRPGSHVLKTVTASRAHSGQKTIVHDPPLVSLEKLTGVTKEDDYRSWLDYFRKTLGMQDLRGRIVQSYKRDGVACALYYKQGRLVAAALRPRDGIHGEDITENVKHVKGVPTQLPIPITCSIRGELECPRSVFEKIKADWKNPKYGLDKEPANSRNYTAGSIRQFKDPTVTAHRALTFTGYTIEALHAPAGTTLPRTKRDQAIWCNKTLGITFVRKEFHQYDDLVKLEQMIGELEYEVDGIVLEWNDLDEYEQCGRHGDRVTGNPRAAKAWKFKDQVATTSYTKSLWSVARTGEATPVAQFDTPLDLAQTKVRQCSLHNIGFMARNGIVPGVQLEVIKSGKIIPKVIAVIHPDGRRVPIEDTEKVKPTRAQVEGIDHPANCPVCGHQMSLEEGGEGMWSLFCPNATCPAQVTSTLVHFLFTLGLRGIGDSQVEKLLAAGKIKTPADFFSLDTNDLKDAGLSTRQALLALAAIWGVEAPSKIRDDGELRKAIVTKRQGRIKVPAWQLFAALGVPQAGKQAGKDLIDYYHGFEVLLDKSAAQLEEVPGVGATTADLIANFLRDNGGWVRALLQYIEPQLPPSGGKLEGKVFVLTGDFEKGTKKEVEARITALSGKVAGSVSKNVHYLVCGQETGVGKKNAARKLQGEGHPIKIITEQDLEALL